MKFNVRPDDCRFIVNKEKQTIVCIYEGCDKILIDFINENCKLEPFTLYFMPSKAKLYEQMAMPNRFTGVAVCSENDEWDENIGRTIAFSRMKDKLNHSFFKRINTFFHLTDKWLDEFEETVNQLGFKLEHNQERRHQYIETLIGKE